MEIVKISDEIQKKINLLEKGRRQLQEKANYKAETIGNYDRKLAIVLIRLKTGQPISLDGNIIEKPPASIMEKIAKGICWEEALAKEQATAEYALTVTKLQIVQAELNALQSIFRHLQET